MAMNAYIREEGDGDKIDTRRKADVGREREKGRTKMEEGREGKGHEDIWMWEGGQEGWDTNESLIGEEDCDHSAMHTRMALSKLKNNIKGFVKVRTGSTYL